MWLEVPSIVPVDYALVTSNCECNNENDFNVQSEYCRWCLIILFLLIHISFLLM